MSSSQINNYAFGNWRRNTVSKHYTVSVNNTRGVMELERALHEALDNIAQTLGFKVGHYTVVVDKGYEYLYKGVETLVTIKGEKGECTYLKIKRPPTTPSELNIPWGNCFFNNVHYYTTVLPILKTYGNVPMTPKYHGSSLRKGEEYLILEDLEKSEGYKKLEPHPGMNRQQINEVIKMLAYFHCTVQLWKTKNPKQFKSVCSCFKPFIGPKYPTKEDSVKYEKILKEIFIGIWDLMKRPTEYHGNFSNLFKNIRKLAAHALKDGSEVEDQPWTTIVNCYTYITNFLFKCHTQTGAVIDVGLEDWSSTRLGSPALDLSLLLLSSPLTDILSETPALLNAYFTDHLSVSELKEKHIPRFGIYGLFTGVFITVAKAIEDKLESEIRIEHMKAGILTDELFTSNIIPDVKERLVAIVKAALAIKIF